MNVLTFNAGSSSLKYGIYAIESGGARRLVTRTVSMEPTVSGAKATVASVLSREVWPDIPFDAIGHRMVFGGPDDVPAFATPVLFARLERFQPLDPLHLPVALAIVRAVCDEFADVPSVVCFDTEFFRELPDRARVIPIQSDESPPLRRYGFHGLSYEYIRAKMGCELGRRSIVAHLGSGASVAALNDGKPVECTMGFSTLGGIVMATRPGDLDPGVLLYLLESGRKNVAELRRLLEERSGVRALSGGEADLRVLLERSGDARAATAVDVFCTSVAKAIGAFAAVLGGLDTLVFTGGVGEHLAPIRSSIVRRFEHLGMELDREANDHHADVVSLPTSRVVVRVVATDENATVATATASLVRKKRPRV